MKWRRSNGFVGEGGGRVAGGMQRSAASHPSVGIGQRQTGTEIASRSAHHHHGHHHHDRHHHYFLFLWFGCLIIFGGCWRWLASPLPCSRLSSTFF